jgi:hypothetical protein
MRWTGQIFWLLAYDACAAPYLLPAFTADVASSSMPMTTWAGAQATNFSDWPSGKLYPVTAAQLLPILTGFLAPIHFSKLAKNWNED